MAHSWGLEFGGHGDWKRVAIQVQSYDCNAKATFSPSFVLQMPLCLCLLLRCRHVLSKIQHCRFPVSRHSLFGQEDAGSLVDGDSLDSRLRLGYLVSGFLLVRTASILQLVYKTRRLLEIRITQSGSNQLGDEFYL